MNLIDRLQIAYDSPIGSLLIALLGFLVLLVVSYLFLRYRQKQADIFAFLHQAYYEKAEKSVKGFTFVGSPKADFFGRQSVVKSNGNKEANLSSFDRCIIPPPSLVDELACDRFRCFYRAIQGQPLPTLAPLIWKEDKESLILVQGKLIRSDGCYLPNFHHFLADKKLNETDKEKIMLRLAKDLARLHSLHSDIGERLYHGFLLPRSIFVNHDSTRNITQLVVADMGLVYAIGPQVLLQRLEALKAGSLPIEKYCARQLLEQLSMLAPEQKNANLLDQVGPAADFYAFAAFAVGMFSKQRFSETKEINWNHIPQRWQPFLKACLSAAIVDRPKDFLEFEDWLDDPESALTHHFEVAESIESLVMPKEAVQEENIPDLVQRFQTLKKDKLRTPNLPF